VWTVDADAEGVADLATSTAEALWQLGRRREAIARAQAALRERPGHGPLTTWLADHRP
jgi:hypothetical protein